MTFKTTDIALHERFDEKIAYDVLDTDDVTAEHFRVEHNARLKANFFVAHEYKSTRQAEDDNDMMKRLIVSLLRVIFTALVTSCSGSSSPSPTDIVKSYFEAHETFDIGKLRASVCDKDKPLFPITFFTDDSLMGFKHQRLSFSSYTATDIYKGFSLSLSNAKYEELSRSDDVAQVHYEFTMIFEFDRNALRSVGIPDADIDLLVQWFTPVKNSNDVKLITENGKWVICTR